MHIGLIGGIGPAATDLYYRGLIARAAAAGRDLELTIVHADAPTLLGHLGSDDQAAQTAIYLRLTERLARAGAECVVVTSIAGHFCIDAFAPVSPLPVVDMMAALKASLAAGGMARVGVLGTATVMATGMYGKLGDVAVMAPAGDALGRVHEAYVATATTGKATPEARAVFFEAGRALVAGGAEAVLLGGTDLAVAFESHDCGFAVVDCAEIHIDAVAGRI